MRILMSALLLACLFAVPAHAAFDGPRSPVDAGTVATVNKAANHTPCQLEGHIIEKVASRYDNYVFQDNTGKIIVSIREGYFRDQTVTPQTKVRIYGIIDKEFMGETRIRVRELQVLQ